MLVEFCSALFDNEEMYLQKANANNSSRYILKLIVASKNNFSNERFFIEYHSSFFALDIFNATSTNN